MKLSSFPGRSIDVFLGQDNRHSYEHLYLDDYHPGRHILDGPLFEISRSYLSFPAYRPIRVENPKNLPPAPDGRRHFPCHCNPNPRVVALHHRNGLILRSFPVFRSDFARGLRRGSLRRTRSP